MNPSVPRAALGAHPRETSAENLDAAIRDLGRGAPSWPQTSLRDRIELARACLAGVMQEANGWIADACRAKGIDPASPLAGEEIASGPLASARYLQLLIATLTELQSGGSLRLPGATLRASTGQLTAPVFPTRALFDRLLFAGFSAHVWFEPQVAPDNLAACLPSEEKLLRRPPGVVVVLGAGNVGSIPITDALGKLFHDGRAVLLKMNPVNEYLGSHFERALAPLIERNVLRVVYGPGTTGQSAIDHVGVDEVHITGASATHQAVVWGAPGGGTDAARRMGEPRLTKPITSELGSVTPWIVVPGAYSRRQMRYQAENIAASIVNNASFNCIATKVIVTCKDWPARESFLDLVAETLARIPFRKAYYPGAVERFARFAGGAAPAAPDGTLPWTLLRDVHPDSEAIGFREESFVCVCLETGLSADTPGEFLRKAAAFANERLWGTLGASITVPAAVRKDPRTAAELDRAVAKLNYGAVAINQWSALSYAIMSAPWGGAPGGSPIEPGSGVGWVHNTYLLEGVQKTVLEGPLAGFPKPLWFPTHRRAGKLARLVLELYGRPRWTKLPRLLATAIAG